MEIRELDVAELGRAVEIDVTEDGATVLEQVGLEIRVRAENWSRSPRSAARWAEFAATWRGFIPAAGIALGALEGGRLVGIATLRRGIRPGVDQLEALFVDRGHRRLGVATALCAGIEQAARDGGARTLVVSATPSESAVGTYRSRGFTAMANPLPELLEREPEDVHLVLEL